MDLGSTTGTHGRRGRRAGVRAWWRSTLRRPLRCALIATLLLAGCDPADEPSTRTSFRPSASPSDAAAGGGTLRWAIQDPSAIVPAQATDAAGLLVVDALFDSLTFVDADGTVTPRAAVTWEASRRGRRWRFTLRRNARYHDGTPVRARDFVRSWSLTVERGRTGPHLQDVAGYRAVRDGRATMLSGVRAIDDLTLEVRLRRPDMTFPAVVAHPTLAPLPAPAFGGGRRFAANPLGNGPYRMAEPWSSGQFIRVERDDEWRNGPRDLSSERVREVVFRIIDPDAGYVAFQQGRLDVAPLPAGALEQARRTYGLVDGPGGAGVVDEPVPSLYFLGLRVDAPPWDDPAVRRALSQAIDRGALVDGQGDLELDPARRIVPPPLSNGSDVPCDACLHSPSLASAAFERAGVTEATLTIDEGGGHDAVARRIQTDLAAAGVALMVQRLPFEEYLAELESGGLGLYRFGWHAQHPTAGAMLDAVVGSDAPVERGDGANYGGYASPAVDDLLDRARRADSSTRRRSLWTEAERLALEDQAVIPLFSFRQRTVIAERVTGLVLTPWGTATPERAMITAEPDTGP